MKEIFYLNGKEIPTIPVPHDCIVRDIKLDNGNLVFSFEDDISYHDSIKNRHPNVKTLIIRFHLLQDIYDINLFIRSKANRFFHKAGVFKEIDLTKRQNDLINLAKANLEYLYHNVGYCSIIVKLWSSNDIVLDITSDYVEFEWIEF